MMRKISYFVNNLKSLFISILNKIGIILSDKQFLQYKFYITLGHRLNLKNPKTFQEKIQWLKLYNRKNEYTKMVDKYAVKDYAKNIIGEQYIIPTLGVWDRFDDVDFNNLPDKFVLKTTHSGGSEGVIICKDKVKLNIKQVKTSLQKSLNYDIYKYYREWPYKNVPHRIIAEQLLELPDGLDLIDYKIFCFNGIPRFIQVIQNRTSEETIDFFDTIWNHQPFVGINPKCKNAMTIPEKPQNLQEMLTIAEKLSKNIPFVRVDLYNYNSKIYFGELTFFPASGMGMFTPNEWSYRFGEMLDLSNIAITL